MSGGELFLTEGDVAAFLSESLQLGQPRDAVEAWIDKLEHSIFLQV